MIYSFGVCLKKASYRKQLRNDIIQFFRRKSSLGYWDDNISTEIKLKIEKHWSSLVLNRPGYDANKPSYYILPMFPYPSGNLHMGHVRVYSISDTIARFHKLNDINVIHPIGWDAFGLPAENAAIERNIPPHIWTESNIQTMKTQLLQLGFNFDWDKEVNTCDPSYYKWTQYIFLKLYENGLAYQSKANVNWDPVDKTVLADEQVDDNGCSWRSGAKVEKKILTQWFIKTTKYAKSLYDGLDSKELENWNDIINLQKHWIGECNGIVVNFEMKINGSKKSFDVWTSDPYKLIHGEYVTISTNHVLLQELDITKMNILTCHNPITNSDMPVIISDNVEYPEGRDVYIACASFDENDKKLSASLNIPLSNKILNSDIEHENKKAVDIALKQYGGYFVSSKLKDWLISRQRYWGTPIPIIHCPQCGPVPVPYEDLPVQLPEISKTESGSNTLSKLNDWVDCKCPQCLTSAKRETDTMDTFVDSSWYYYRYLDSNNDKVPFSKESLSGKVPVTCYIGGKEHAVLHLYYARFMSYFLNSFCWTPSKEPFKKLLVQGMVMGQSYKVKSSGKYIPIENVEKVGKKYKEKGTGEAVSAQWEKMSKSKYNGENPQRLLSTYGCDTTRLLILADVPPATSRHWSDATLPGVLNWQRRLWITIREFLKYRNNVSKNELKKISDEEFKQLETKIWNTRNYLIATTTYHFKHTQKLSVGISRLQSLTNLLRNNIPPEVVAKSMEFELALAQLIIMISPVMPHFCSELWAGFLSAPERINNNSSCINWNENVLEQKWPVVNDNYELSFQCKVDGTDRCDLKIKAADLSNLKEEEALQMMLDQESVAKRIKSDIINTKYELYPDCRAILHIYTRRKETKPVEEKESKSQFLQA
ncbi:leucine--tRNA ligase, mitochondrial [Epargyreus clarus]|uniref:leucine--tRNA ligase, mitochondrial n=1 Tax=Epargyreus clarus TaxID=520877 RepID=UPI003C2C746C